MKLDERSYELLVSVTKNCRLNIRNISRELGSSYLTVRKRIMKMMSNGYFTVKPMVSARLAGLMAGLVRVKHPPPWIFKFLAHCNRVLAYFNVGDEIVFLIYGRDKQDIVNLINRITEATNEFLELTIEFGKFPMTQLIPIKNIETGNAFCSNSYGCKACITGNGVDDNNKRC